MRVTLASWTLLSLFAFSAACGDDDDDGEAHDAGQGEGGVGGDAGSGGQSGSGAARHHCDPTPRALSEVCRYSPARCSATFTELRDELCGRGCSVGQCSGNKPQIFAGSNDCGGTTISDRAYPTIHNYHFDAAGELIGAEIRSDDCLPGKGEYYGMGCSSPVSRFTTSTSDLIDCGQASPSFQTARM